MMPGQGKKVLTNAGKIEIIPQWRVNRLETICSATLQ
jgi:hypothetical protein